MNKMSIFRNLCRYNFFIVSSVKNELITRFSKSKLGVLWAIINPLIQVLIYAVILSSVLSSKLPGIDNKYSYALYLMSGILCWNLFNEILSRCMSVFTDNENIIKKISFPKIVLPAVIVLSAILNNLLLFIAILIVFSFLGHFMGITILLLPFIGLIVICLSVGFGIIFGVLNVFVRDVSHIVSIILQFLFWLTPVVYMLKILPPKLETIIYINPLVGIIQAYHDIMLYNKVPDFYLLIYPLILAIFSIFLSYIVYTKANEDMADML